MIHAKRLIDHMQKYESLSLKNSKPRWEKMLIYGKYRVLFCSSRWWAHIWKSLKHNFHKILTRQSGSWSYVRLPVYKMYLNYSTYSYGRKNLKNLIEKSQNLYIFLPRSGQQLVPLSLKSSMKRFFQRFESNKNKWKINDIF